MKHLLLAVLFMALSCTHCQSRSMYSTNKKPLVESNLIKLPLGAVRPQGWLRNQLQAQADGLTGHLDEFWPDLINSAWKGGDGESWERGPYYLDGLIPLAYILDDSTLKTKAKPFIDWILDSQQENGWFGPGNPWERWPLAISCKVLTSYYEATHDERALEILNGYFRYLRDNPPDWPDDSWRGVRAMEHAVTGYWLYRRTQDPQLLQTIQSIFEHSYDWTTYYETFPWDAEAVKQGKIPHNWDADGLTAHVVNNAMAFKYPGLWYQQSGDERFKNAVYTGLQKYDENHGQVGGRFSGDEHLSGHSPTQGTEMCAIVESMFSLEKLIEIFGEVKFADRLELLAFNSLPGTMTPDCWAHQYDQQANQALVSVAERDWSTNGPYSNIYGLMPNYPCCLANFHQGWPKFVEHMWYTTPDGGLAAMAYGPNRVTALVGKNVQTTIRQISDYPFSDTLRFEIELDKPATFPLYFRIPSWAKDSQININKAGPQQQPSGKLVCLKRKWRNGDVIQLVLPSPLQTERRFNNSVALRRGPLYFALRIEKEFTKIQFEEKNFSSIQYMGSADWKIEPLSAWNYGLAIDPESPEDDIQSKRFLIHEYPFADRGDMVYWAQWDTHVSWQHEAPLVLTVPAKQLPDWGMKNHSAANPPVSPILVDTEIEMVQLVPYGCARLRISEFPVVEK